jgi:glucose/arabinose dehydrogenase
MIHAGREERLMKQFSWMIVLLVLVMQIVTAQAQNSGILTDSASGVRYTVEQYLTANFPVGMVFAPDGTLYYNEKITGNVRFVRPDGTTRIQPVITLPTDALQERGMLGITLSPNFAEDRLMYVMHTQAGDVRNYPANRLVRFVVDEDQRGGEVEELLRVPIENGLLLHNGGNVHFDEDGYLFVSLGDYGDAVNAQDLTTPQGALHRFEVTADGLVAAGGNPFGDDNSIYAYGLRNPFDFTIDPLSDLVFVSESGPDCDDEVNAILPGFNYGWGPDYACIGMGVMTGLPHLYAAPMLSFTPTIAPTGIVVYQGDAFPEWEGDLLFCDWNTGTLRRVELSERRTRAEAVYEIDLGGAQCRVDLVIGPEGGLYFGTVGADGGAIMRLLPAP